jgi:hypothetical protein
MRPAARRGYATDTGNSRLLSVPLNVHLRGQGMVPPAQAGIAALALKARLRVANPLIGNLTLSN